MLVPPSYREHAATRIALARMHLASGELATAERMLSLILETDDGDRGLRARAWSTKCELAIARKNKWAAHAAILSAMHALRDWLPGEHAYNSPFARAHHRMHEEFGG